MSTAMAEWIHVFSRDRQSEGDGKRETGPCSPAGVACKEEERVIASQWDSELLMDRKTHPWL